MRSVKRWIGGAAVLALGMIALACGPDASDSTVAPDLDLPLAATGPPTKLSRFKGKVVALDFWATWCGPCRQSIPALEAVYKKHHAEGFEVIGISADSPATAGNIPMAIKDLGITYPIVLASAIPDVTEKYDASGLPTLYLIDKQGNVVLKERGVDPKVDFGAEIETAVADLLKQ